jgi:3,4-dihydroxy-2-butanone 4-phosphate synthase/flavin reductase (DIM6/NTAB) family NADH-FMN oxidoreductase RutF
MIDEQSRGQGMTASASGARQAESVEVRRAAAALRAGEVVIVNDEKTVVLAVAADSASPQVVNQMIREGGGILSVAVADATLDVLGLPAMSEVDKVTGVQHMASVDIANGSTGISAADRADTIRALSEKGAAGNLIFPGHIVPLRVSTALGRASTSIPGACIALARIAGVVPAVATCEVLDENGAQASVDDVRRRPGLAGRPFVSTDEIAGFERGLEGLEDCEPPDFREVMSQLVSGVLAITVRNDQGEPKGMLATSVTSYSDQPPSVLACIAHRSRTHDVIVNQLGFGVHLLSMEQGDLANKFAQARDDKFSDLAWAWDGDVPRIGGACGYLRCRRSATFPHRDHTILIGEVEVAESGEGAPLVYFERKMGAGFGG